MNITVTGGNGYIGSHLIPVLKSAGHKVRNYRGDILDFDPYYADMVIHLASLTGVRQSLEEPEEYYKVNVEGFRKVVEECKKWGCKLLYASSSNAEEWWSNPYAVTKKITEVMAEDIDAIGFRPHTVYPGRPDMLYNKLKSNVDQITYINGGHYRDFTHVEDVCSAILTLVANYCIIEDKVIDIGTGTSKSVLEIALMMGFCGEVREDLTPNEREETCADITVLKKLGWKPTIQIKDYIENSNSK